jgi:hypothetical protein
MTLEVAFETLRTSLNATLVPYDFPNMVSLTPKHPDHVESDSDFPYLCLEYAGEMPEYEGSDNRWIQPTREMARFKVWVVLGQSETESSSVELMKIVKKIRDAVVAITSNPANEFRIRVDEVEPQYEPSGRWALALVTVTIGAYGN